MGTRGRATKPSWFRWATGALVMGSFAFIAYFLTRRDPPPRTEVAAHSTDRERDRSAWIELYERVDEQEAAAHAVVAQPEETAVAEKRDVEPAEAPAPHLVEPMPDELPEGDTTEPLGGMSLEMIPPPEAPLEERAEATQSLYNEGDDLAAREAALALLEEDPGNVRLIRIVASTACMDGLTALARRHYDRLPGVEQRDMRMHCLRHGTVLDQLAEADDEAALDQFFAERSDDWDPARTAPPGSEDFEALVETEEDRGEFEEVAE